MIEIAEVQKSFGNRLVLDHISLTIAEGTFFGIIGPNGSGKSTLLKLLSGVEKPDSGKICIAGQPVGDYSRKELARILAALPQEMMDAEGYTVREVLEMGRFPYQNWLGSEKQDSHALIDGIMDRLTIRHLEERSVEHLSGGERQRTSLGKTMVQQPKVLLLDEPTTYLDIGHQVQLMDYIQEWKRDGDLTVVAVLHDLNLAAQYCDRLLLLHEGRIAGEGAPADLIDVELISRVYGTRPAVLAHPLNGIPQILLQPGCVPGH